MRIGRNMRALSKYKNRKVERGGVKYDSQKEAKRAFDLELKQRAGEVSELKRQVKFILQESFKTPSKKTKQGFDGRAILHRGR